MQNDQASTAVAANPAEGRSSSLISPPSSLIPHPFSLIPHLSSLVSLTGLGLCVFAVVALSSAGRIDVIDGQTRYQVARSIVEYGDSVVRDADTWFAVFPGRNGDRYSNYRFPHTFVAVAAILAADASGPAQEIRRQFFFALSGALLCGAIAILYASWFRRAGHSRLASLAWAAGGVFCTPIWYYGTTAYDEVLGTLVLLAAIYAAHFLYHGKRQRAEGTSPSAFCLLPSALISGLLLGLAFNCKPPLVLFMPAVIAPLWRPELTAKDRWLLVRVAFFCAALGVIIYELYDLWKFPPSTWAGVREAREEYVALWPGNPLAGFLSLLVSPGMGAIWYWPAVLLAVYGLALCGRRASGGSDRRFAWMVGLSSLAFLAFISTIRFFSGEPAWGPRYLTPVFGVLWLFVPLAASHVRRWKTLTLLTASLAVQLLGLTVEPMRFFTGDNVVAAEAFLKNPWTYFRFDRSQLLARPQQVWDVLTYNGPQPASFTPAKAPTLPLIIYVKTDKRFEARDYQVLSALRPWWLTFQALPPGERPVDLNAAISVFSRVGGVGLVLLLLACLPAANALIGSITGKFLVTRSPSELA